MVEIFAEAADRFQAGESIEQIVGSYSSELGAELRELLTVVGYAEQMAAAPVPQPSKVPPQGRETDLSAAGGHPPCRI